MIKLQTKLCRSVYIACSGGVDSMAVTDFLYRNHSVTLMFFNHDTQTSHDAEDFLKDHVLRNPRISLELGRISRKKKPSESWEEYWRNERYEWFHSFDSPIVTCHHLDDCVETWIWSSMHGQGKIIPFRNKNVIRPFRLNRKSEFLNWARRHGIRWVEDTSNEDPKYMRNFIRKEVIDKCLIINPGLHTVIQKKVRKSI